MGLDMFVFKEKTIESNMNDLLRPGERRKETIVKEEMLSLRKAYQIDRYINEHTGGADRAWVSIDTLRALKMACDKVIENSTMVKSWVRGGVGYTSYELDELVRPVEPFAEEARPLETRKAKELRVGDKVMSYDNSLKRYNKITKLELKDDRVFVSYDCYYLGELIEDATLAKELLPLDETWSGAPEYSDWYMEGLKSCSEQIAELLIEHQKDLWAGIEEHNIDYYYEVSF